LDGDIEVLIDMIYGAVYYRLLLGRQPLDGLAITETVLALTDTDPGHHRTTSRL
jgi:hypothetical protein